MVGVFVQVGKQAGIDQTNLAEIGEQQVLSQRIAKYALAASGGEPDAFAQLASSKNRFADILGAQRNEFLALTGTGSDGLTVAFSKFESSWNSFNHRVDEILDGQALVLAVVEAADLMNEVMPQLLENSQDIVDILVKSGAGDTEISLASRQSVLSQRIVNNINNVMTGDDAEAAAVAFAEDTSEFGRVLLGMIHGRNGIQAVKDSAAQAKLRQIAVLFSRVSDHVGAIVDNSEKL
ncbi:MAG: hypothetical protein R3330_14165, partial [Saprospiraceae bacterium]|nr:hypothetical protein [Saprospiraceae bacterium]